METVDEYIGIFNKYINVIEYEESDNLFLLKYIELRKKFRRKGFGSAIMMAIIEYCKDNKKQIILYPSNAKTNYLKGSCHFYSKLKLYEKTDENGFIYFTNSPI